MYQINFGLGRQLGTVVLENEVLSRVSRTIGRHHSGRLFQTDIAIVLPSYCDALTGHWHPVAYD